MSIVVHARSADQSARIAGTGVEVWEVIKTFLEVDRGRARLETAYDWLSNAQLDAAFAYAREHADAIDARIQEDYAVLPEPLRPDPPLHWC